jgi:purine-nucleoside phosphorylase
MRHLKEQVAAAVAAIHEKDPSVPKVGMILGTGLGGLAEQIETSSVIPYENIPQFPRSTVQSHAGQLVSGRLCGVPVVAMEGRFHFYEGYSMQEVTFPVRVMKALGIEILITTNAAGGMDPRYNLADVVILNDTINFMGDNPLRGINDDEFGPRFPDMCAPFDAELISLARRTAAELDIAAPTGVLVAVAGPNLETRAEYRMLRILGGDVVSMSTVPEVIVAAHAGLRTLGFSVVTDLCNPEELEPVDIRKILAVAAEGGERLSRLIPAIVGRLGE